MRLRAVRVPRINGSRRRTLVVSPIDARADASGLRKCNGSVLWRSVSDVLDRVENARWRRRLAAICLMGIAIRVAFIWFRARGDGPLGDQLFYSAQAFANARGDWFEQPFADGMPAADHPPLTALVITPVTWLFEWTGSAVTIQRLFIASIGCASIVVMAVLGAFIGDRRTGLIAAGLTALYVNVWMNDGLIMAESLTFLLVALVTLVTLRTCVHPTRRGFALVGLLAGLSALTRTELAAAIPMLGLLFVVHLRSAIPVRRLALGIGVLASTAAAVIGPWIVWNQIRFDGPALISTNDGLTLAGANCDSTYFGDVGGWDIWCAYETEIPEGFDAAQASALMRDEGLAYWRENLDRYPVVAAARLARVFSVGFIGSTAEAATAEGRPVLLSHIGSLQYWAMLPLAFIGLKRRTNALQRVVLLGAVPLVALVALVANAYVRFRVPMEVGLVTLAALGIASLMSSRRFGAGDSESAEGEGLGAQSNRGRSRRARVVE